MKQWVGGFLFADIRTKVLLIRKDHPTWMRGKLNGVGGSIEHGESALDAMKREFLEETGINIRNWNHFASLSGSNEKGEPWIVYWYVAAITSSKYHPPQVQTGENSEPVHWFSVDSIIDGCNGPIMPNLKWLILMAKANLDGIDRALGFNIQERYKID